MKNRELQEKINEKNKKNALEDDKTQYVITLEKNLASSKEEIASMKRNYEGQVKLINELIN
jgi:hypothetical protein